MRRSYTRGRRRSSASRRWWTRYRAYLASPAWATFRASILAARGRACEKCGATDGRIDVHHTTYVRMGHELPADVLLLCLPCHRLAHPGKRIR